MRRSLALSCVLPLMVLAGCGAETPSSLGLTGTPIPQPPVPGTDETLGTPGLNLMNPTTPSLVPHTFGSPANLDENGIAE